MTARIVLACLLSAVAAAAMAGLVVRPRARLAGRMRPYTIASRSALGADLSGTAVPATLLSGGTLWRLFGPMVVKVAGALGGVLDSTGDAALLLRLRQAGLFQAVAEPQRAVEYRVRQLAATTGAAAVLGGGALVTGQPALVVVLLAGLGCVVGATRWRSRVDQAIAERRGRMQIELYTVNQLLALHLRVGGGVVQALQRLVARGRGAVVEELAEILALHRSGRPLVDALEAAAATTPEPHAARTYRLLANGVAFGADLGEGLRALSADLRNQRAEAIKRAATRRRAAMLVPIIAVLAPVMLLFIAAPLPSIVLGSR